MKYPEFFGALTISDGIQVGSINVCENATLTVDDAQINKIALQDHARCIISGGTVNSLSNSKHAGDPDAISESVFCAVSGGYIKKLDISYQEGIKKRYGFRCTAFRAVPSMKLMLHTPTGRMTAAANF